MRRISGCSSMVERKLPKLQVGVRFPSPALKEPRCQQLTTRLFSCLDKTLRRVDVSVAQNRLMWPDRQKMTEKASACTNLVQALVQARQRCRLCGRRSENAAPGGEIATRVANLESCGLALCPRHSRIESARRGVRFVSHKAEQGARRFAPIGANSVDHGIRSGLRAAICAFGTTPGRLPNLSSG